MLGEPQLLGRLTAGPQARVSNFVNANRLVRKAISAVAVIAEEFRPRRASGCPALTDAGRKVLANAIGNQELRVLGPTVEALGQTNFFIAQLCTVCR